jgi:hypothetical protein
MAESHIQSGGRLALLLRRKAHEMLSRVAAQSSSDCRRTNPAPPVLGKPGPNLNIQIALRDSAGKAGWPNRLRGLKASCLPVREPKRRMILQRIKLLYLRHTFAHSGTISVKQDPVSKNRRAIGGNWHKLLLRFLAVSRTSGRHRPRAAEKSRWVAPSSRLNRSTVSLPIERRVERNDPGKKSKGAFFRGAAFPLERPLSPVPQGFPGCTVPVVPRARWNGTERWNEPIGRSRPFHVRFCSKSAAKR